MTLAAAPPEAREHLDQAWDVAWQAVDPDLLALCSQRIAALLGHPGLTPPLAVDASHVAPDLAAAATAYVEQYLIDVAQMTDEQVAPLRVALGDDGLYDFAQAVLVVEQRMRLQLMWEQVL